MRSKAILVTAFLLLATALVAQKKEEKPKLHSDFYLGTYPVSRDAANLVAKDNARFVLVGFHQGWNVEKIAKESKQPEEEIDRMFADLEEARLVHEEDLYTRRPMLPVIRDRDIEKIREDLSRHTDELAKLLQSNWPEIEAAAASFSGAKDVPKAELLYQIVVGGILFGGMQEAFFEDQTLMIPPPRRQGSQRYYAWLVESEPRLAGLLKREQWESEGYTLVSIGAGTSQARTGLTQVRTSKGMLLEEAEARRFRSFIVTFSKDKVLPYFKKNRSSFLKALNALDAGKYVRVSDAFAWYYDQVANGAAETLTYSRRIQAPAGHYTYAIKTATR